MNYNVGMRSLDSLSREDLVDKTIFIRVDFNVPMTSKTSAYYRVADDSRIRRFLDLTFKKIHTLTDGNCRFIIASHLGRPHVKKDHSGWDGIFNIQFVCSHFDTLMRKVYGDVYTIFPPEVIGTQFDHSLEIMERNQLPIGGIKFLPNLRYLLDPENPDTQRKKLIEKLAEVSDVYINCAFGCSHRQSKSIKMLPQIMRNQGKPVVAGNLLYEEVAQLGNFGKRILDNPDKTAVITGGAKISDKIGILKQFAYSKVKYIFLGGKMVNAFLLARQFHNEMDSLDFKSIPTALNSTDHASNQNLIDEIKRAHEILNIAKENQVLIDFPVDYKIVNEYKQTTYQIKSLPDFNWELQLDLGPKTIKNFSEVIFNNRIENIIWNGPLGAYDHPHCDHYAEGSIELVKLLFSAALLNEKMSVVIGGGDTAAILNKLQFEDLKMLVRDQIRKQVSPTINPDLLSIEFKENDCYNLYNYFTSNFFVSTGGGASLTFLEGYLNGEGNSPLASYLPGTTTLMELSPA